MQTLIIIGGNRLCKHGIIIMFFLSFFSNNSLTRNNVQYYKLTGYGIENVQNSCPNV